MTLNVVSADDPGLPAAGVDTILLVNTYRHLSNRVEYARKLRDALAPGGRLVVIDGKPSSSREPSAGGALVPRIQVDADLAAAGLVLVRAHSFLPEQYFVEYMVN